MPARARVLLRTYARARKVPPGNNGGQRVTHIIERRREFLYRINLAAPSMCCIVRPTARTPCTIRRRRFSRDVQSVMYQLPRSGDFHANAPYTSSCTRRLHAVGYVLLGARDFG